MLNEFLLDVFWRISLSSISDEFLMNLGQDKMFSKISKKLFLICFFFRYTNLGSVSSIGPSARFYASGNLVLIISSKFSVSNKWENSTPALHYSTIYSFRKQIAVLKAPILDSFHFRSLKWATMIRMSLGLIEGKSASVIVMVVS